MKNNNITPELLAQMHAALRGNKFGLKKVSQKYTARKKTMVSSSLGEQATLPSTTPVSGAQFGSAASKGIDVPLAESVGQTTAETVAEMNVEASGAMPEAIGEDKEENGQILDKVFESEIEAVESKILNPLLEKALPPIENGVFEIKDVQDKVIQRTPYLNGKVHGEVQLFDTNGKCMQTYTCVEDLKQGPMRYFDGAGNLTHEVPYEKDKRQGMGTFYVNGTKTAEITFHQDAMQGPAIYYSTEGYISAAAIYQDNYIEGEMRCFDSQQRLVKTLTYHKGQLMGDSITYYPGGVKVFERITYVNNVPMGKHVQFYENGMVLSLREYDKGKLVKEQYYDSKGKEISKPEGEKIIDLFPHIPNFKK